MTRVTTLIVFRPQVGGRRIAGDELPEQRTSHLGAPTEVVKPLCAGNVAGCTGGKMTPRTQPTMMRRIVQPPPCGPHILQFFRESRFDHAALFALDSTHVRKGYRGASDMDHRRVGRLIGIMETQR